MSSSPPRRTDQRRASHNYIRLPSPPPGTRYDVELAPLTSLGLGGAARCHFVARTLPQLRDAFDWAKRTGTPATLLSGGSNTIVPDAGFDGIVVQPALRGVQVQSHGDEILLRVGAGEPWDGIVAYAVANGWQGIECLSGIPGWAGAAPVQNIGAYGQELCEAFVGLDALDRRNGRLRSFTAAQCKFDYRTSRFKQDANLAIVALTLRLRPGAPPRLKHEQLREAVSAWGTVADARREVLRIRRDKSMVLAPLCAIDDENRRSAGSYFVNPVLEIVDAVRVRARAMRLGLDLREMPWFRLADGRVKLSAAWLIERAGIARGYRRGTVGVSTRHCLALVHHGSGRTDELFELEQLIRERVHATFDITLQREPVLLGSGLPTTKRHAA